MQTRRRGLPAGVVMAFALAASLVTAVPVQAATPTQKPSNTETTAHTGLQAQYYLADPANDFALSELKATLVEQKIDVANQVPLYQRYTGKTENTGVRYTGELVAPREGDYTFVATGDNGFRLNLDGKNVIDWWVNEWDQPQTGTVHLTAGEHALDFSQFQATGGAHVKLEWSGPGLARQVVPTSAFRLPSDYTGEWADVAVDPSGEKVQAVFDAALRGSAGNGHVSLLVDGRDYPVTSTAVGASTLTVKVKSPIIKGTDVRLAYDGKGSLSRKGTAVKAFDLPATNASEYRMSTPWASKVNPKNPLPEYPRPQLQRSAWKSLNGAWTLATLKEGDKAPLGTSRGYGQKVTVPYPLESTLSGVGHHEDHFAYRRSFTVPASWRVGHGQRLKLQFGAVDYDATVYVNGKQVAHHVGGYEAFSADITKALRRGENELVVQVTDTTGNQPRGKQDPNPSGIFYTPSSGIWQTVWMEPVPEDSIGSVKTGSDLDKDTILVTAAGTDPTQAGTATSGTSKHRGDRVKVTVTDGHRVVGTATGTLGKQLAVRVRNPHLWTPDDPHLYNLTVTSGRDTVRSYVGMRSISVGTVNGQQKVLLNGKPTFLLSTLDQGYWPDGVYTAPTDQALAWDIQQTKDFGFNTIRKHIKVEPARWYYHADQIGMLVWQDLPANNGGNQDEASRAQFTAEAKQIVSQLASSTSVIGWVTMNEGWGEWSKEGTGELATNVKSWDPTRLVNAHSGVNCCNSHGDSGKGDVIDWHMYTGPAFPHPDKTRAAMDGEHGGFSLSVAGHVWPGGSVNPYGEVASSAELTEAYVKNTAALVRAAGDDLSGSVYTQLTDVEGEVNGLWTYDRRVQKMDKKAVRDINRQVIAAGSETVPRSVGGKNGVASWKLDEGRGSVARDSSRYHHTLSLGSAASWAAGVSRSGLSFTGSAASTATAQVPQLDTTGNYTVSTWVKLSSLPAKGGYATFVSADGKDGKSPFFLQYGNEADVNGFAFSYAGGPRAVASGPAEVGKWYHLVAVRSASDRTLSLYVNGSLASTVPAYGSGAGTGTVALGRGQWEGNPVDFLTGNVDEVRLWDRALSAREVARL